MELTLLENAEIYAPKHIGKTNVLYCGEHIIHVGEIDNRALKAAGLPLTTVDLHGLLLTPGFIDPHAHLLGGSGENGGFSSQTPEIALTELVQSGITTVVGTLGADTTMKTMPGLLAKVKGLNDEGLSAYCYTGGYTVPPTAIMKSVRDDIIFIDEVIATGEVAISDSRSNEPEPKDLARIVIDTHMAGMLTAKAGVTHFHVGKGERHLQCLIDLLEYAPDIEPSWLYPTHINRNEELLRAAVEFGTRHSFLDMDVVDGDLHKWLKLYGELGGSFSKLTLSSDAALTSPQNLINEFRECVLHHKFNLEELLPLVTKNTATILKLKNKGEIKAGFQPSFLALDPDSLELIHVISRGKFMLRDGTVCVREKFLENSNREVHLIGDQVTR